MNYPSLLIEPKFFIVAKRNIVKELDLIITEERDGTVTYSVELDNNGEYDGLVFYFEGMNNTGRRTQFLPRPHQFTGKDGRQFEIKHCREEDIKRVYSIELSAEFRNAATEQILYERLIMFQDGFLVVSHEGRVVGYTETVLCREMDFNKFEEISNFPMHYDVRGNVLYVIFIAVDEQFRKLNLGLELIRVAERLARHYGTRKIKLVAKDQLVRFYQKNNFHEIRELPDFLKNADHKSILMEKILA